MPFARLAALSPIVPVLFLFSCNSTPSTGSAAATACPLPAHLLPRMEGRYLAQPFDASGSATPLARLRGHVPPLAAQLNDFGKLADDRELPITVALNLNNEAELDQRIAAMYRPGDPNYRQFTTPAEFRARYAPTEAQVAQVLSYLRANGLQPTAVSDNRLLIQARGTTGHLNAALRTELHGYSDPQGVSYFAPAYELQLPADLPIQAVHGLQNLTHLKPYSTQLKGKVAANAATGPNGGFSPADIRAAYRIPSAGTGAGESLALFELDGFASSDISAYESNFGLPAVPLKTILVNGATGSAGSGAPEVTLDIELMIAVAPQASQILVYEGTNDDQGILATYGKIANDNLARQISTSWGSSEGQVSSSFLQSENTIFKQMAAQGQSIFAAAGDAGAYDNGSALSVDDPGSQPYVAGVGGTRLTTNSDGSYASETTWGSGSAGGGGGVSSVWSQPTWQNGLTTATNLGSTTMRNVPDVSLNADPATGYAIYSGGSWSVYGGTSCAAPLWAAFTALVNQERTSKGMTALGFANPTLYQVGRGGRYASDFFDIADGSTNLHYPATQGYDDATGWGSFNGTNLLQDLAIDPTQSTPVPPAPPAPGVPSPAGAATGC